MYSALREENEHFRRLGISLQQTYEYCIKYSEKEFQRAEIIGDLYSCLQKINDFQVLVKRRTQMIMILYMHIFSICKKYRSSKIAGQQRRDIECFFCSFRKQTPGGNGFLIL
jgi:hypothetical protein